MGSAALAAFLLFSAYIDEINHYTEGRHTMTAVNLNKPAVFVGALLGAMLVFWFSALCIKAVGRSAQKVNEEVRRQFKSLPRENGIIVSPPVTSPTTGPASTSSPKTHSVRWWHRDYWQSVCRLV